MFINIFAKSPGTEPVLNGIEPNGGGAPWLLDPPVDWLWCSEVEPLLPLNENELVFCTRAREKRLLAVTKNIYAN
jgi:hypothetical protein